MPVSRLLKAHLRQILGLEEAAVRRLFGVYRQAELEIAGRLQALQATNAEGTFTAQHLAIIRAQIDDALRVMWQAQGRDLRQAFTEAIATGARQAHAEIVDLEQRYGEPPLAARVETVPPVVPAQQVAFLADDQNLLLSRFRDGVFRDTSRELSLSVLMGESIPQAAQRVGRVMAGQRYQLERIARTEINHAANVGHFHTIQTVASEFPEMGLKKQWSAHLDMRACRTCRSLHLQVRATGEQFQAANGWRGQFGPAHPNCRCRVMPYSDRWEARSVKKLASESYGTPRNPGPMRQMTQTEIYHTSRGFEIGRHVTELHSVLDGERTGEALAVFNRAGLLDFLERKPLARLNLADRVQVQDQGRTFDVLGVYRNVLRPAWDGVSGTLEVVAAAGREPIGQQIHSGRIWGVHNAAATEAEQLQRFLIHEVGHHLHRRGGPIVDRVIQQAFTRNGHGAITQYGRDLAGEYFAECHSAFVFHRDVLRRLDPVGYDMVMQVRGLLGIPT